MNHLETANDYYRKALAAGQYSTEKRVFMAEATKHTVLYAEELPDPILYSDYLKATAGSMAQMVYAAVLIQRAQDVMTADENKNRSEGLAKVHTLEQALKVLELI